MHCFWTPSVSKAGQRANSQQMVCLHATILLVHAVFRVVNTWLSEDLIVAFDTSKFRQEYRNYVKAPRAPKVSFRALRFAPQQHCHARPGI